jgi:nicotinate-nucleotide pyrophosphorylase (carboxylating)
MRHPTLQQPPFAPMTLEKAEQFRAIVTAALAEDGAGADVTSMSIIATDAVANAALVFRRGGVLAGLAIAALAFAIVDPKIRVDARAADGEFVQPGNVVARIDGPARSMLASERVALNFVGHLSGIATLTRAFVDAVSGTNTHICDTRKTTPGLRALERYAVRCGGGFNHRFNLSDAVLIKDNHIAVAGSVAQAVARARAQAAPHLIIEVECESLEQVQAALECSVDAVLLDNMALDQLRAAVAITRGRAVSEASGGITLDNVREIAQTGVDVVSIGALTHSAPSADVALDFV